MMLLLLLGSALAAEPQMSMLSDDRTVQGVVEISAPIDAVRAVIQDPHQTAAQGGRKLTVSELGRQDECLLLSYTVHSVIKTVTYTSRMCPTHDGSTNELVESQDIKAYRSVFTVEDLGGGRTRLTNQVMSEPNFAVPAFVLKGQMRKEIAAFLTQLSDALER